MKRLITYIALCLTCAVACEQLPEDVQIYGVGCKMSEVALGIDAGEYALEVYADGEFTATLDKNDSWIRFSDYEDARTISGNGDMTINLEYDINKGIPRTAILTLVRGTNTFELSLNQDGILEGGIEIEQKNISVPSSGGQFGAKVITRLAETDLSFEVTYKEDDDIDWISGVGLKNNFICFDVKANLSASKIRHAVIAVINGNQVGYIQVSQFYDGCETSTIGVSQMKALLDKEGTYMVDAHLVLEGFVINDNSQKNGAENRMISLEAQDLNYPERILYIQEKDGSDGVKLIFTESCADIIARFEQISVDLYGMTIKREDNPVRYSINGLPTSAIISTISGDVIEPKDRTLETLTDHDLYTLVKLNDVHIPVRKGNYAPVDIRYVGTMTSYPMVIRSKGGATGYMMVNINCPWSRDGQELPEGSGSITGAVVYETCDNFEWDAEEESRLKASGVSSSYITGLGKLPCMQIRPFTKSDVNIADNETEGFSKLLYEWAYCDSLGVNLVNNYQDQTLYPTYPLEENPMNLDAGFYCTDETNVKIPFRLCNDFTHLGPYTFGGKISDPSNGNGIYDYYERSAHWAPYGSTETIGVLYSYYSSVAKNRWSAESNGGSGSNGAAWCVPGWSTSKYWCAEFSTADLTTANSPLNVTFGTMNHINSIGAPRYWKMECSVDGKQTWIHVGNYTVPDFVYTASLKTYQLPGTKFITMNLPDSALGASKVYVRLIPASAAVGTSSSYAGGTKISTSAYNAINYFAIRYNNN